jgi:hypothetical protein
LSRAEFRAIVINYDDQVKGLIKAVPTLTPEQVAIIDSIIIEILLLIGNWRYVLGFVTKFIVLKHKEEIEGT